MRDNRLCLYRPTRKRDAHIGGSDLSDRAVGGICYIESLRRTHGICQPDARAIANTHGPVIVMSRALEISQTSDNGQAVRVTISRPWCVKIRPSQGQVLATRLKRAKRPGESNGARLITITGMGEEGLFDCLPSFDRPPVIEVAVGVHFLQLPGLNTVGLVRLVDDLWRSRYPQTIEQPLAPPVAPPGRGPMLAFQLQTGSLPIRLWSLSEDKSLLVQVQHDRLLLNWRKVKDDDPYPRYKRLRADFAQVWQEFSGYIRDHDDYGVLQPSLSEVSFFNRVPMGSATDVPGFVKALNPEWELSGQLVTAYQVEREVIDVAPGYQNIALNYRPENGHMQLEISTRIEVETATGEASEVLDFLDTAHRIGVLTFDAVTTDNAHSVWGRQDAGNS